jgi:hypothetical protein
MTNSKVWRDPTALLRINRVIQYLSFWKLAALRNPTLGKLCCSNDQTTCDKIDTEDWHRRQHKTHTLQSTLHVKPWRLRSHKQAEVTLLLNNLEIITTFILVTTIGIITLIITWKKQEDNQELNRNTWQVIIMCMKIWTLAVSILIGLRNCTYKFIIAGIKESWSDWHITVRIMIKWREKHGTSELCFKYLHWSWNNSKC